MVMKRLVVILLFLTSISTPECISQPCGSNFVSISQRDFKLNGANFYPLVLCYSFNVVNSNATPTANDYWLSRYRYYGANTPTAFTFEGQTQQALLDEINADFGVIRHQMGFNAIRTAGIGPEFNYRHLSESNFNCGAYSNSSFIQNSENLDGSWGGVCMDISTANSSDDKRDRLFQMYGEILELAAANDLKVLIDIGYTWTLESNNFPGFLNYVGMLVDYINTLSPTQREALMAYVIVEEPAGQQPELTKYEVCERIADVYDLIKARDLCHLVTVGGLTVADVLRFDPGIMKVDFWCPHLYPYPWKTGNKPVETSSDLAVLRVLDQLYWLKQKCSIPWMIGETGFAAIDDNRTDPSQSQYHYPTVNGELEIPVNGELFTQKSFAQEVLRQSRDCGASGCSFWQFQQAGWSPINDLKENGYGLLRFGEASTNYSYVKKPVVDAFIGYLDANGNPPPINPNGCVASAAYYNHFQIGSSNLLPGTIGIYNPSEVNAVTGQIIDDDTGSPLKNVYVEGYCWESGYGIGGNDFTYNSTKTFTSETGLFKLVPYNFKSDQDPSNYLHRVSAIKFSSVSTQKREIGQWQFSTMPQSLGSLTLKNFEIPESIIVDYSLNPISLSGGFARQDITLINVNVLANENANIYAENSIRLGQNSLITAGSETRVYIDKVAFNCDLIIGYTNRFNSQTANVDGSFRKIELQFDPQDGFSVELYPNPTIKEFTIKINNRKLKPECRASSMIVGIINMQGMLVLQSQQMLNNCEMQMRIPDIEPGVYEVLVKLGQDCFNKKLVILNQQ
jgi:hypothetical protein